MCIESVHVCVCVFVFAQVCMFMSQHTCRSQRASFRQGLVLS